MGVASEESLPAQSGIGIRRLKRNFIIALAIIAVLSFAIFFLLLGILRANEHMAAVINAAARQRMFSQRASLYALRLVESEGAAEREANRAELRDTVDTMEMVHDLLHLSGGTFEGHTLPGPSEEVRSLFFGPTGNLDAQVRSYISEARELASDPDELLTNENPHLISLLDAADQRIPEGLDEVVNQYQMESDTTVASLESLLIVSVSIILLALALEGVFIFRPMVGRIRKETLQLEEAYGQQAWIAETLQRNLISGEIPLMEGLKVGLFYRSATQIAEVGGDFYDFISLPGGGWGIVLGDVAGKGVDAAVEQVKARELISDRAYRRLAPGDLLQSVNDTLTRQYEEKFIAVTYAVFSPHNRTLSLANAGNPYPLLMRSKKFLKLSEPPLAAAEGTVYTSVEVPFEPGDAVLFYTDGLAQARTDGGFFGLELDRHVAGKEGWEPERLVEALVEEATRLSGGNLTDDILVMVLRRTE